MTEALKLKEAGNKAFKAGNIQAALGAYSYSLEKLEAAANSDDTSQKRLRSEILSNRALCLAKIGEHNESLTDAESAIACDSSFAKGYLRKAQALLALKRPKEAIAATIIASEMDKEKKITKSVTQLTKKCNKMIAPRAASKKASTTTTTTTTTAATTTITTTAAQEKAPAADVHTFAQQLVTAALSCGVANPEKSKFEGSHLILTMVKDGSEKRLHVADLFARYEKETTLVGRSMCLMDIVRQEIVGFSVLPHNFEIARHLLRPRLFSRQKLDSAKSTAMPDNDDLPCWMLSDGTMTSSQNIQEQDSVAVAVVVDYGQNGGMLPIMKSTCEAWQISFEKVREVAMETFRQRCLDEDAAAAKKKKKEKKEKKKKTMNEDISPPWKSHMSGCLTSPWTDNTDGARLALFPEMYAPEIPLMEGQPPRGQGIFPETIAIFGTNNCVLVSEANNPISQCFAGDIVINDMEKTADHVSSTPHRLVRGKSRDVPWLWRRYIPCIERQEFSIPSSQIEIDGILDAVQSGGKKRIPIFGNTETAKICARKNIECLLAATKRVGGDVVKDSSTKSSSSHKENAASTGNEKMKMKSGFFENGTKKKSVLNDQRTIDAEKKKKQVEMDSKSVDGLDGLAAGLAGGLAGGLWTNVVQDVLVESCKTFDGPRDGCVFRDGEDGVGYYKDIPKKIGSMVATRKSTPVVEKKVPTIDVATLNRSIGLYGSGMSGLTSSSTSSSLFGGNGLQKKSLFSL